MQRKPDGVCDFCSDPKPLWAFPCATFKHKTLLEKRIPPGELDTPNILDNDGFTYTIESTMYNQWAACEKCAFLIWRDYHHELAKQVILQDSDIKTVYNSMLWSEKLDLLKAILDLHDVFRANRLPGPPEMIFA